MNGLIDFINQNYIEGIINDTSYNHFDMITYVIILFAGVYAVLKLLNKLSIRIDEEFFAICVGILLLTSYLEKLQKIRSHIRAYAIAGVILSLAGVAILIFNSSFKVNINILAYSLVPAITLTWFIRKVSPAIGMTYLRSRMYSFAIFSFLLDSFTTYIGVDMLGYTNKHPFSFFFTTIFGTGAILIPLSLILIIMIILLLEKDSRDDQDRGEKYMLALTSIVLGFSMGARNLLAMVFGV